jgi:hypothetical protein
MILLTAVRFRAELGVPSWQLGLLLAQRTGSIHSVRLVIRHDIPFRFHGCQNTLRRKSYRPTWWPWNPA